MRKVVILFLLVFIFVNFAAGQTVQNNDTVVVLPFENVSVKAEFNWVGESFAASLADLLKVPGLNVVGNEERKIIQQRLKVPLTTLPSLATSLKIARESKASILISGKYNIVPAQGDIAASISVTAKIIRVNEGRFLNEELPNGNQITGRQINLIDALASLQTIEGQLAYQIMYQRDKSSLAFSQNDFIKQANKVPAKAFEAYIKGLLTQETDTQSREVLFKNAMRLYAEAKTSENAEEKDKVYADASIELGHFYLNRKQIQNAVEYFSKVPAESSHYAEAAFYIGLIYWQQNNYEQALAVLSPLADELKLTSVYNTLGAIAVEASKAEKKDKTKAANNLTKGLDFLKKASESDPEDPESRFNYSVALYLTNNFPETASQVKPVLALNPRDGEAYYLLAKALQKTGDATAVEFDNQARRFLANYAKLETDFQRTGNLESLSLRVIQPPRKDFVSVIMIKNRADGVQPSNINETDVLLEQAQTAYKAGRDDEAMQFLRRIIASEPINGRAYLLLGKIHLRRGDFEQASNSLKTALFYDNSLIDAHIALAKIFIEKKDCQQAQNFVASAVALEADNPEVGGIQRLVERCSK
ncbi:MAG: tetratricopeptide repeat protein [Acidobacteriota bacterium]